MPGRGSATGAVGLALIGLLAWSAAPAVQAADGPKIVFLDAAEAAVALSTEETQAYFDRLQTLEMSAKTGRGITGEGLVEQRAECRRRYLEATLDFTSQEISTLVWAVTRIHPHVRRNYPRVVESGWSFLKVESHIEGGLPHTVGPHIVLSPRFLASFAGESGAGAGDRLWSLGNLLLHEQIHVTQRRYPRLFDRLYSGVWGFRKLDSLDSHPWLLEHQVINPDSRHDQWVYQVQTADGSEWIWPTVMLGQSRGVRRLLGVPSLARDIRMVAVGLVRTEDSFSLRLDPAGAPMVRRLLSFQEYRAAFPFSMAPYHPDEIAAEGFARIVIAELARKAQGGEAPSGERLDPRTDRLKRWFATHLD